MPDTVSPAALALLYDFEQGPDGGFAPTPYRDSAGVLTIGWGHVVPPGVNFGGPLDTDEADLLLRADMATAEAAVRRFVTAPLTQSMFDALVCFIFNLGVANFSGSSLLFQLNQRHYTMAANEFPRWNKARNPRTGKKEPLAGLTRRRAAERALFLQDGIPNQQS